MPRRKKSQAKKQSETSFAVLVTLQKNGYVNGKLYKEGETVEVTPETKAYLLKKSPEVYQ